MKWIALILLVIACTATQAQRSVQTIVPLQPIAVGSAFQVQYIVTGSAPVVELQSPAFGRSFRFVSGPRLYQGEAVINNKKVPVQNFSYTLIPLRKGRQVVKGATAVFGSGKIKSDDTFVVVTEPENKEPLASTPLSNLPRLAPGTNWKKALQEQIFIKTAVSKRSGFVGEPVVATFTLFSRLPSASEIIKNPGFYGFSVLDMPEASEGAQTVQTHNGAFYNTHVLRKVQLYPAQPGNLVIDKMSVNNAIEYADSASGAPVQTTVLLESEPAVIAATPLPAIAPASFTGAVGRFAITAYLDQKQWRQNRNGKLVVRIGGTGNFLQLAAPEIRWPKGVDVSEPTATERLQKEAVPLSGTRTYAYTLTADSTGHYTIPPIAFTYFDAAIKKYKTITTDSLLFSVLKSNGRAAFPFTIRKPQPGAHSYLWWLGGIIVIALAGMLWFRMQRLRHKAVPTPRTKRGLPDFESRIQAISPDDTHAYRLLQQELMGFLKEHVVQAGVHGSMRPAAVLTTAQHETLQAVLEECEAVEYSRAAPTISFYELQQQAIRFVQMVKRDAWLPSERG